MSIVRLIGLLFIAVSSLPARASGETSFGLEERLPDTMLDCARLADLKKKLKCFDRVRSHASNVAEPKEPSQRQQDPPSRIEQSRETAAAATSTAGHSAAIESPRVAPRSQNKDPNDSLARYALEVVRQLGKEMHPEEYPVRAREQGIGGTVRAFLRIGADARIADVTVADSSGNDELDQYVIVKLSKLHLPPVPDDFRARAFTVQIPVQFTVRGK